MTEPRFSFSLGDVVAVRTADGKWVRKIVVGAGGEDFPCLHLAWEDVAWTDYSPWPVEDIEPIEDHPDALTHEAFPPREPFRPAKSAEGTTERLLSFVEGGERRFSEIKDHLGISGSYASKLLNERVAAGDLVRRGFGLYRRSDA